MIFELKHIYTDHLHIKNGGNSFQSSVEHGTIDWFKIGKGVRQAVYCHPVI